MTYAEIILAAAVKAKVSGSLLLAICTHETNLKNTIVYNDGPSHSYGICMVKYETAQMLGFKGKAEELMNEKVNAKFAAKYLKYQEKRYFVNSNVNDKLIDKLIDKPIDWCKLAAAYNAGSYLESKKVPGKPKNLKYVRKVQKMLPEHLKDMLSCEQKVGVPNENTQPRL